jgi:hypothetical protein
MDFTGCGENMTLDIARIEQEYSVRPYTPTDGLPYQNISRPCTRKYFKDLYLKATARNLAAAVVYVPYVSKIWT